MKKKLISNTLLFIIFIIINVYLCNKNNIYKFGYNEKLIIRSIFILIFYLLITFLIIKGWNEGWNIIFKHRYKIVLFLFIICIAMELNGSSIAMWSQYISAGNNVDTGTIFGVPRAIRSDEWSLNTPMALSQYYNYSGSFPYFSDIVRGTATDVFLVYGQPVWDIGVIFRPFHWGYLFMDPGRGLSFFWYGRLIALFIVTFEFGLLITKNNKRLSLISSLLVSLAPIVQWWFAINGLVEMLVFGQLAIIMINKYINSENYLKKIIYMGIMVICAGGYILTFYPSWQIPLFYVFFSIFIWIVWENYKNIKLSYKDIIIIAGGLLLLTLGMMHIFIKSGDTINAIINTAYPGKRLENGGGEIKMFFNYAFNMFLPYRDAGIPGNVCEQSVFIDFFPLGIILSIIVMFIDKKKDKLLICLLTVDAILSLWCIIPWPTILAKLTLLSNSQPSRTYVAVGFINILVLIRAMSLRERSLNSKKLMVTSVILACSITLISKFLYSDYINKKMFLVSLIFLTIMFVGIFMFQIKKYKETCTIMCILLMFISGATVNPVQRGVDVVYNNPILQEIKKINDNELGKWIVEGMQYPVINYPIMVGAPTINSTNIYPTLERWNKLNNSKQNQDIYNRYAHININLQNSENSKFIKGIAPDTFTIDLNIDDLSDLDVKYILTQNNIEDLSNKKTMFTKVYDQYGYKIYKVS